jgi:hypothetical protein
VQPLRPIRACLLWWLLTASPCALAQDPLEDAMADEPDAPAWSWFGDLLLRGDITHDLPLGLPDETRSRGRVRGGILWQATDSLTLTAAGEASQGSDSARVIRLAHDNERINDLNVDLLLARWQFSDSTALLLGKAPLPLELTSMVWDPVLRPIGAVLETGIEVREFDRLVFAGGYLAGDHLYGDESRILALQAGWRINEGAPTGGSLLLSFLGFDDLEEIAASGLARSNRRVGNRLISDYDLLDLLLELRTELASRPLLARVDLVKNLGADDLDEAARGSLQWGDSLLPRQWEVGYSYQRIQRDAVMAAFNSQDWWFHSAMRGHGTWLAYGFDAHWRAKVSVFIERADGRAVDLDRTLIDVEARW